MIGIQEVGWIIFFALIAVLLALDLGVFHRKAHDIPMKEAVQWTIFWIGTGLLFMVVIYVVYLPDGSDAVSNALQTYITGYVLEKMLSVDNMFVFIILFQFFGVKGKDQHKLLFYGIMGAIVLRGVFIFAGVEAIRLYAPTLYFFGGLLIVTAIKMATMGEKEFDPAKSKLYRFVKRILPLSHKPHEGRFIVREDGKILGTTLLLTLFTVELTDIVFAIDSVPAVLGITRDPFIVYTSNVFAILGLRALYFVIASGVKELKYLKPALVVVLLFIGIKMILEGPWWHIYEFSVTSSLIVVVSILAGAVIASKIYTNRHERLSKKEVSKKNQ